MYVMFLLRQRRMNKLILIIIIIISMTPWFCNRVNIVLGIKIKTSVRIKQTAWY